MASRTQTKKPAVDKTETIETPVEEEAPPTTKTESHDKAVAEIDDLLDEIDSVLEENSEEFVKNFIMKGGE